MAPAKDFVESK